MTKNYTKPDALMLHYVRGTQDVDSRRIRKNGWNDVVNGYMSKLPANWPFLAMTTVPLIRTSLLEKTSRLLNAKLQGRLIPREGGDMIKAKINNALLDFQWDFANEGGSMIEKIANADQISRLFGAAFVLTFWNTAKETNEIKVIDPRDIWFDGGATHIRNAKWVQAREWTTVDMLEQRGYEVKKVKGMIRRGEVTNNRQDNAWESVVKANRSLENRVGEQDNEKNPIIEVVTEWTSHHCTIFLPRYGVTVFDGPNPYLHHQIPIAQLRYYPLGDDIYGESEAEPVLPLQRAANVVLCGFLDEMMIAIRPPIKVPASGIRRETIEYGPGAQIVGDASALNSLNQLTVGGSAIGAFNTTFPAIIQQFNVAMGDQSLGVSNVPGKGFNDKTATEVKQLSQQQNNRDQYNQLYLGEFLKDIMMMWLSNNKQYLLDDPTKKYYILKIIGRDNVKYFQQMKLDESDIPDYAMQEISDTVATNPNITDEQIADIMTDVAVPTNGVITNPNEPNPENYDIKRKLDVAENGEEADLYLTQDDFDYGMLDYIPDVSSMAAGAGQTLKDARQMAIQTAVLPPVAQGLMQQGYMINWKELLQDAFQDGGIKDAEGLIVSINQNGQGQIGQTVLPGLGAIGPGAIPQGVMPGGGMGEIPQAIPVGTSPGGIPQPQGI